MEPQGFSAAQVQVLALMLPVLLLSVIAHEYAHGYAALRQGDNTALMLGRLTWNPIKHIDPWMTIFMPLLLWYSTGMIFGGAKPVPVNARNFRNYKRGDIIVSLAGVTANLIIAVACVVLVPVLGYLGRAIPAAEVPIGLTQAMLMYAIFLNLLLVVFNLIPIPPLDGSHVMKYLLPTRIAVAYASIGGWGLIVLIVLLWTGWLNFFLVPFRLVGGALLDVMNPVLLQSAHFWLSRLL